MALDATDRAYLALLGEPALEAGSSERASAHPSLERALAELTRIQRRHLRTPLEFVGEGRFLALLRWPWAFCDLVAGLEAEAPELPLRFGLGWGPLCGELRARVHGMEGPCFEHARRALDAARKERAWALCRGLPAEPETVVNGLLQLLGAVRRRWKPKQRETIVLARQHARRKEVARRRSVSEATVSRSLEGALYAPVLAAESALATALELFTRDHGSSEARKDQSR